MKTLKHYLPSGLFVGLLLALGIWILYTSLDFQECVKSYGTHDPGSKHLNESFSGIISVLLTWRHCAGAYVLNNNAVINAIGTVFIAVFTTVLAVFTVRLAGSTRVAADAANLNAQAVMDAEGAHLYPVIQKTNISYREVFFGPILHGNSSSDTDAVPVPTITYRFKNYGKTPAVLQCVHHKIDFFETPPSLRSENRTDASALEIIGADAESADIEIEMLRTFDMGMAKSVIAHRGKLIFFGTAVFTDFFNRQFRCEWECDCSAGGVKLTSHEQRLDPDQKKNK